MTDFITPIAVAAATKGADKGTSKLLDLLFSKQMLRQRRLETLSNAQDLKDAELIQQGIAEFRDGSLILINEQIGNPTSPLGLILHQNSHDQHENVGKCLNNAYQYLSEQANENVSDENISDTFFNKWINYGKEISEEELQNLWGNILAKEISEPSSINYLVLNTLSLMNKKHLEAFNSLVPFILNGHIYCNPSLSASENFNKINKNSIGELVDFNIIKGILSDDIYYDEGLFDVKINEKTHPIIYIDEKSFIAFYLKDENLKFQPHYFLLTSIGNKLFEIALNNIKIEDYFKKLVSNLKNIPDFKNIETYELFIKFDEQWKSINKIT